MKKQTTPGQDTDEALAKAGTGNPPKKEKLRTEEPIAEKDEVKQARNGSADV